MDRRDFMASLGAATVASHLPLWAADAPVSSRITLLHTNDTHSHIEPFGPGNGPISGLGGVARRATLVRQLRRKLGSVLLLDAGDTFQGTPYFNRYKGRLDYQLMCMLGYDAGQPRLRQWRGPAGGGHGAAQAPQSTLRLRELQLRFQGH